MKLALFADIHANLEALDACLAHARQRGPDALAFVGDLVGYGADPGPVVDRVAELVRRGAVAVAGNHDVAACSAPGPDTMNPSASRAIRWTRDQLGDGQRNFLAGLPLVERRGNLCFVHASAETPADWIYVTDPMQVLHSLNAAGTTYVFSGHVHTPTLYYVGATRRAIPFTPVPGVPIPVSPRRRWLAVVGAVGQPRDGNTAASYALADVDRSTLTFFRVPYDWPTAAAKIRAAGLPEALAQRLSRGE